MRTQLVAGRAVPARTVAALAIALLAVLACGGPEAERAAPDMEAGEPAAAEAAAVAADTVPAQIGGSYRVEGFTVDKKTGNRRAISGTVILALQGGAYTATFDLDTVYTFLDEETQAEVIGKGEGVIEGRTLRGTAQTQIVMASVPGVDPGFAFVPRHVSTRIVSSSVTRVEDDGTLTIEIDNEPAPGEDYAPTRTTLHGEPIEGAVEALSAGAPS